MFNAHVRCFLWDLVDEGVDQVLDRLQGEIGASGIAVAADSPPVACVRPHKPASARVFRSPGGTQFQPDSRHYSGTRLRPVVAGWLKKGNPLPTVMEACRKRGLTVRFWLHGCCSPAMAERNPTCTIKDVFGDPRSTWLCPVNPDVREYLRAVVHDLVSSCQPDTLELSGVSFPPDRRSTDAEHCAFDTAESGEWLRNLCFCESCRQLAARDGIDVEAAARAVSGRLDRMFRTGEPPSSSVAELLRHEPALAVWQQWRSKQVHSLLEVLRQACRCRLVIHRPMNALATGLETSLALQHADAMWLELQDLSPEAVEETVTAARAEVGNQLEAGVSAGNPPCPDSATLVRTVSQLARSGISSAGIGNYGLLPLDRLDWLRQAIRYARRESA